MQPGRLGCPRRLKRAFWRLIATGMQSDAASRTMGLTRTTGIRWFGEAGGVPPIDLAEPSARFLSISEREEIAVLRANVSAREIARRLHRAPSTIVRELRRNAPRDGQYRALLAQKHADHRSERPSPANLPPASSCAPMCKKSSGARRAGARSRSPAACGGTSPTMRACGSLTRRSTKRSTSRDAVVSDGS